jgi:catechol 2,3-dioxygenase-like lactoylglutathione lyase family enzyme
MIPDAKYVHTNLIARDWRVLARFYEDVFGCTLVPPERNLFGPELEAGTGVRGARLHGVHLRLPGNGSDGPTLEIFQYAEMPESIAPVVNRPGLAHLAFSVPSVPEARKHVLASEGSAVGGVVTTAVSADVVVTWCYVRDPEGNIIELQSIQRRPP